MDDTKTVDEMIEKLDEVMLDKPELEEKDKRIYHIKGGLVEKSGGELTQTKMFEILEIPLDDYSDLTFTQAEARRMRMHAMNMRTGVQAMIPVLCLGPVKCPFRMRCPIVDRTITLKDRKIDFAKQNINKFPLYRQCPIERDFLANSRRGYLQEFNINIESPTEVGMANKLAELDLLEYRLNLVLANGDADGDGPTLMKTQITGVASNGSAIERLEEHPAMGLKNKLEGSRMRLLDALVGTRRERYKREAALKQREVDDISTQQSTLKAKLEKLNAGDVVDAEFTEHIAKIENDKKE